MYSYPYLNSPVHCLQRATVDGECHLNLRICSRDVNHFTNQAQLLFPGADFIEERADVARTTHSL
ncbi:hypothetical protein Mapa_006098 [Marchantia paleacea]|nr:hypothetical protein Mapa_006098 [Marchantia paleacea]